MEQKEPLGAAQASTMSDMKPIVSTDQNSQPAVDNLAPVIGSAPTASAVESTPSIVQPSKPKNSFFSLKPLLLMGIVIAGLGLSGTFALLRPDKSTPNDPISSQASSFAIQDLNLSDLATTGNLGLVTNQSLSVNGQLRTNNSLVITPTDQPATGTAGQLYFDRTAAKFSFYNGTDYEMLSSSRDVEALQAQLQNIDTRVTAIPPAQSIPTDIATLSAGNTFSNLNTFSAGLSTAALSATGNTVLQGSLTVNGATSLGPTTIASLLLSSPLGVGSGGTGATSLAVNGVVIANGTDPLSAATYASGGQCLMSPVAGVGAPVFDVCPGGVGSGVNMLNGLMGNLVIANATAAGSTITINDASSVAKGIASFNAANFTVTGGSVNTAQNISSTASPTFAALTATTLTGNGAAVTNVNAAQLNGQAASYYLNATNISTGTLADGRLSAAVTLQGNTFNGAGQLVQLNGLGQLPALSGTLLTSLNASSITSGALADARLSANVALLGSAANFTSTLQQSGNNVCNASNNCGYLTGAAADGNYIQLQVGTPGVAQTGNFNITGTGIASALTATTLTGNGAAVTNVNAAQLNGQAASYYLNATNISTGTLADTRLSSNVALLGAATSNFTGVLQKSGNNVCDTSNNCGYLTGAAADGSYVQLQVATPGVAQAGHLNITGTARAATLYQGANQVCDTSGNCAGAGGGLIGSGTAGTIAKFTASGTLGNSIITENLTTVTVGGTLAATALTGGGTGITSLNATNISTGTLADGRLSAAVTLQGNTFNGAGQLVQLNGLGQLPALSGTLLTSLNASSITSGALADARLSANVALLGSAANFTSTLQQSGNNVCNASNNCGYLTGAAADGNYIQLQVGTPGVAQTGNFNITGTGIASALTATTLTGNGAAVTNVNAAQLNGQAASYYLNATNISTGTLADTRLSSNVALLGAATSNFTGVLQKSGNNVCDTSNNCGYLTGAAASGSYIELQATSPGTAQTGNLNISGTAIAANFTGGGANLTSLNASNVSSGTLADARLSANVALLNAASNTFTGNVVVQGSSGLTLGVASTTQGKLVLATTGLGSVTLQSAAQSASVTLNIPANTNATDNLCLQTLANCTGSGVSISGTAIDGRLTKFNAAGQIMNSNLSEAGTTLTYSGNAVINAATGFTGNLIDIQLNGVSRFSVNQAGVTSVTGLLGAYGGVDTNNQNISAGNGSITGAINSTAAILLNGVDINAAGTLTNVAYLNQANTFSAANTFTANTTVTGGNLAVQTTGSVNLLGVDGTGYTLKVGQASTSDTFTKLTDPAVLPISTGRGTSWSPDGQYMTVADFSSPYILIYKRNGDTFTKLANPATLPTGASQSTSWSPDGQYMSVAHSVTPFITIYKRSGDTFTKLADPATLPAANSTGTSWSPDGQYMSVAHSLTPFITIYKRSGDTFTKLANPATLPTSNSTGTSWSPDGQYMSVTHTITPFITIYKRSGDTFAKLANPATLPPDEANATSWSPDGQYMSVGHLTTPFITIYKRSGDTFTKLANPATLPTGQGNGTSWSPDGQYMSVAHSLTPFITIYKRSGDTFTKLANPATLPTATGMTATFSPDSQYMSVGFNAASGLAIYKIGNGQATNVTVNGLLNGSSANFASLYVAGASVLQNSLLVQGAVTLSDNLTVTGTINGLTVSSTALSSAGTLDITGGTTLTLRSTTTNAVSLDSGTTGAVNIGTGANAKTLTVGNVTGATAVNIQSGTGGINLTGIATVSGNLVANSGVYTGAGAGTLRVSSTGALSNVSMGTSAGVMVAAPTTGALSVATTASTGLCLLSNGSGSAPSFQACPSGSGGWGLTGTAGTTVGTNYVGTSDNQAVMLKANGGAPTPSYIQINSSSADSIGAITIAGNGPAGSSGGGTNWFDVKQAGGATFLGISGSGTNARVQMYLQPGSNIGVQSKVCSTNAVGAGGLATMGVCTSTGTDLAESYNSTQTLEPGDIVATDPDNYPNVLRSDSTQQSNLIGIVSTAPDYVMGEGKTPDGYPIALNGRVPTKVNGEGGPILPGDKITSSSVPGVGKKATDNGMIVGTALTGFSGTGQGVIEVFVHLNYYEPAQNELLQANTGNFSTLNVSGTTTLNTLVVAEATISGNLVVKGLATVQSINVKGHIITSSGQPTAQAMTANADGTVAVEGTDTTGTISITTGASPQAGELVKIVFSQLYGKAPRVLLSPSNDSAGGLQYFKGVTTADGFVFNGKSAPAPYTTYKFDYFIAE